MRRLSFLLRNMVSSRFGAKALFYFVIHPSAKADGKGYRFGLTIQMYRELSFCYPLALANG